MNQSVNLQPKYLTEPVTKPLAPSPQPLVSIIIGNYNYKQYVGQAIESALNQTYPRLEVIVVDDGSTDGSQDVIKKYCESPSIDQKVSIIPIFKQNSGQPSNNNAGFKASRGDIICFLDSDDTFLPNKVEQAVKAFQSSPTVGWYFHSLQLVDATNQPLSASTTENYPTCECDFRALIAAGKIPPSLPPSSGLCYRRSLLTKILPMPAPSHITNNDHYVKFLAVALSEGFISGEILALQRLHGSNAATLRKDKQHLKAQEYIYTATWINQRFPQYAQFANKLAAVSLACHWESIKPTLDNQQMLATYLENRSPFQNLNIYSRALYYYLRSVTRKLRH